MNKTSRLTAAACGDTSPLLPLLGELPDVRLLDSPSAVDDPANCLLVADPELDPPGWADQAGAVLVTSQAMKGLVMSRWGVAEGRIRVIGLAEEGAVWRAWSEGCPAVVDQDDCLACELVFDADGGVAVPKTKLAEAKAYLEKHPAAGRALGRQGRLYLRSRCDEQVARHRLRSVADALGARTELTGRRVAIYTPNFLPYDAVSNYVAETGGLLEQLEIPFSIHVHKDVERPDFANRVRPQSDPDRRADVEIYQYPGYHPAVESLRRPREGALRIFDFHGVTPPSLWPDGSLRRSDREIRLARRADAVFVHSRFLEKDLIETRGVDAKRVRRFPYSVDVSSFRPAPRSRTLFKAYALHPRSRVLLYVGRMAANKRIDVLVKALARLPGECVLILAGALRYELYAREVDQARALAHRLGLSDRVVFTGSVSQRELLRLYASADLFVTASLHEGFGIPLIEAMAAGVPCVGSEAGSIPEVIGDAGRTFRPADPEDLADKARELLEDESAYHSCVEAGLRRTQLYTREALQDNLTQALAWVTS